MKKVPDMMSFEEYVASLTYPIDRYFWEFSNASNITDAELYRRYTENYVINYSPLGRFLKGDEVDDQES